MTDVLPAKLPQTTSGPDSTVGQVDATGAVRGDGTCLRCGGCGASATLAARERHYGQLVYGFVDRHESCGIVMASARPPRVAGRRLAARRALTTAMRPEVARGIVRFRFEVFEPGEHDG